MNTLELLILAIGLSMDAFAVSICKGISVHQMKPRHGLLAGLYFGGFQALMPVLGYTLGIRFQSAIESIDHWIAFLLLSIIGINMIREAFEGEEETENDDFSPKAMLPLAVATSIDALAVGVTFAFLNVSILPAVTMIGCTTFLFSWFGIALGHRFGDRFESKATITGGILLILIGLKILLEHLGILVF